MDALQVSQTVRIAIALILLAGAALSVMAIAGLAFKREMLISAARALVQLVVVALLIAWIFRHPQATLLYLGVMLVVAAFTSTRRIHGSRDDFWVVLCAIAAGAGATTSIVYVTGALSRDAQSLLPFAAQMIGGAMTAASLAGVRLRDDVADNWLTFEGYVALGASLSQAGREFARRSSERALFPTMDQTKSAGLVTLPGAFVGLLLGGASPLLAAQIQLLVLVGLMLVQSLAAVITTWWISPVSGEVLSRAMATSSIP